ncbi:hypothetical protein [Kitasatospora brasiliensis]|uniref:hypothetical protein n=1 Tax=Kitasatospora brasiliensis TaxID=3058040 RepID=UPI00292EC6F5|nr:hypothetical protein [Kitasatospora sp. K002]
MTDGAREPAPGGTGRADGRAATVRVPRPRRHHEGRIAAVRQARITAEPAHLPSEHEQAAFELGLVVALVLGAPDAAHGLDLLVNARRIEPEGAEVFGALLYATGKEEGAEFWWRFAAGSGSGTAAYCLHLHHLMLGETEDADYWRAWSDQLATAERPSGPRSLRMGRPLLPEDVRRHLTARVHRGLAPRLPPALVAMIDRLPVQDGDEERVPNPWGLTSGETSACSWEDLPRGPADGRGGPAG